MESINNKIEKAIRFNDYNKAIQLCTDITNNEIESFSTRVIAELEGIECKSNFNFALFDNGFDVAIKEAIEKIKNLK